MFDGPEDYHARIDDPALGIDERTLLVMRGTGPIGYPGAAEVVNMRPPARSSSRASMRCRASATGGSRAPRDRRRSSTPRPRRRSAADSPAAHRRSVRIDLNRARSNMLCWRRGIARRRRELEATGGYRSRPQTPWQESPRLRDSSIPVQCWSQRPSISASRRPSALRGTIIESGLKPDLQGTCSG